jgi:hypothetical protein
MSRRADPAWPALPLGQWQATYATLHLWLQIVGKTRLALAPMQNHWWQVTLHVTPRGLTTSAMPFGEKACSVDLDFLAHELTIRTSAGSARVLPLAPKPVAEFYRDYMAALHALGIDVELMPVPVEIATAIPFADDREHAAYDPEAAHRWWLIVLQTNRVLERFGARFIGKASPVHVFWGSFDLAYTRFSGRRAPRHPGGAPNCPDYVMVEAYSHECNSCGFWPGGEALPEPAFYAYAYPEPTGFAQRRVRPEAAYYSVDLHEFVLPYEAVRCSAQPDETMLEFLQTTYEATADLAGWDRAALDRPVEQWSGVHG